MCPVCHIWSKSEVVFQHLKTAVAAGGLSQAPPSSEGRRYGQEELRRAWKAQRTPECRRAGVARGKGGSGGGLPQPLQQESCKTMKGKAWKLARVKTRNQTWVTA